MVFGAISAGIGAIGGIIKGVQSYKMMKEAQNKINNFKHQELTNPYKNLTPSTLGADLMREEQARRDASMVDFVASAGVRGLGSLGVIQQGSNDNLWKTAVHLDEQQKNIDMMAASQDVRNQEIIEQRKREELAGYGQMLDVGRHGVFQSFADVSNSFGYMQQLWDANSQKALSMVNPQMAGMKPTLTNAGMLQQIGGLQPVGLGADMTGVGRIV